jgi:type III secretory pathway component EscS
MIAAGTFDDVLCIFCFGICESISISKARTSSQSIAVTIIIVLASIIVGALIGIACGFIGWTFKFIKNESLRTWVKFIWCFMVVLSFAIGSDVANYSEAKFIGSLLFGYTSFRVWGLDKPTAHLNFWWFLMQPLLFSTIGATLFIS